MVAAAVSLPGSLRGRGRCPWRTLRWGGCQTLWQHTADHADLRCKAWLSGGRRPARRQPDCHRSRPPASSCLIQAPGAPWSQRAASCGCGFSLPSCVGIPGGSMETHCLHLRGRVRGRQRTPCSVLTWSARSQVLYEFDIRCISKAEATLEISWGDAVCNVLLRGFLSYPSYPSSGRPTPLRLTMG